jgi:hypothetical protein
MKQAVLGLSSTHLSRAFQPAITYVLGHRTTVCVMCSVDGIKNAVHDLCEELQIADDCLFSVTLEQLQKDGHLACAAEAQVSRPCVATTKASSKGGDEASVSNALGRISPTTKGDTLLDPVALEMDVRNLEIPGKPHTMLPDFLEHVRQRSEPLHPLTLQLMDTIQAVEVRAAAADSTFQSPIWQGKRTRLADWGEYAVKQQQSTKCGAMARVEYEVLEHLYEAARLVVASRQMALELGIRYLEMVGLLGGTAAGPIAQLRAAWLELRDAPVLHRCQHLKQVLASLPCHALCLRLLHVPLVVQPQWSRGRC